MTTKSGIWVYDFKVLKFFIQTTQKYKKKFGSPNLLYEIKAISYHSSPPKEIQNVSTDCNTDLDNLDKLYVFW